MVTTVSIASPPAEQMVLDSVSWQTYESLLADFSDRTAPRFAYDQGVLEIVSPTPEHEEDSYSLEQMVVNVATEFDIDFRPMRSTTYRRRARRLGFEADASFYIQNKRFARDREAVDPQVDPPPDLVIEIEVTNPLLDKLPIFVGLEVPEVWRCESGQVTILLLDGDTYRESPTSRAIPVLTSEILTEFLARRSSLREPEWIRAIRTWAQEQRETRNAPD